MGPELLDQFEGLVQVPLKLLFHVEMTLAADNPEARSAEERKGISFMGPRYQEAGPVTIPRKW